MGYMRHHAIVVTSSLDHHESGTEYIERAHAKAVGLGMSVTNITPEGTNGYRSFLVAPDGSKEGWDESDRGDARRAAFMDWLDRQRYKDDSTPLEWVEVQFGDDDLQTLVLRDSDDPRRRRYAAEGQWP